MNRTIDNPRNPGLNNSIVHTIPCYAIANATIAGRMYEIKYNSERDPLLGLLCHPAAGLLRCPHPNPYITTSLLPSSPFAHRTRHSSIAASSSSPSTSLLHWLLPQVRSLHSSKELHRVRCRPWPPAAVPTQQESPVAAGRGGHSRRISRGGWCCSSFCFC